jgi:sterol desaturase/sphingolipid hydroxylase (fatty acid hydroxylase superfamily)
MAPAQLALAGVLLGLVLLEVAWARRHRPRAYHAKEALCNVAIAIGNALLKPAALVWGLFVLQLVEPLRLATLPPNLWVFAATFLVTEFVYYWFHRWSHEWPALWAIHHVHHSSLWMNLTTAVRLAWLGKLISPLFFLPLTVLGFPPEFVVLSLALGLLYQFPLHTQAIGKLGAFEGRLLNTPSAHRVHHGCNEQYLDKNFAATLIVWDVLFGTYAAEREPVRYGVAADFPGHNPFTVQLRPLWRFVTGYNPAPPRGAGASRAGTPGTAIGDSA